MNLDAEFEIMLNRSLRDKMRGDTTLESETIIKIAQLLRYLFAHVEITQDGEVLPMTNIIPQTLDDAHEALFNASQASIASLSEP